MQQPHPDSKYRWLYLFIGLAVLLNFTGLFIPILAPDGTLYAVIAKTMAQRNDFVNIIVDGTDWLDKPHFPFWVAAISFKLFGISTWAYKLPGILFTLVGAVYTYLFARRLYSKEIALWSVLVLLTAQHIILSDNDVRAEPYLTALIIASVYHFYRAHTANSFWQLLLGAMFAGCAVMTKGMFALVPIGGAIAGHLAITRQWKQLFHWRWLLAVVLTMLFILPEIYCLYVQFDIHPEKVVFGHKGVSGIRFFFWDSQFGRFFNTGPIKGKGDPLFFIHTTLWAFLPWSLLLFAAVWQFIRTGIKQATQREWFCISGSLLTFLLFSASKFQLPHYLNIVFPFFAIITAQYFIGLRNAGTLVTWRNIQAGLVVLLLAALGVLHYYFRPDAFEWDDVVTLLVWLGLLVYIPLNFAAADYRQMAFRTLIVSFVVNLYLNLGFYPSLLKYQAGSEAAAWINHHNPQHLPLVQSWEYANFPMEFYINQPLTIISEDGSGKIPQTPFMFYGPASVVASLQSRGYRIEKLQSFERYWISRLKPQFLNRAKRGSLLIPMEVVIVR